MDSREHVLTLDSDYTELLTEHGMDQDLKKALKELTEAVTALTIHAAKTAPAGELPEGRLTAIEVHLGRLEERSKWHRNIGWGIAGLYAAAFLGAATWYIPQQISTATNKIESETAKSLLPIQITLAKLTALTELRQSKNVAEAIQQSADFSTPRAAIEAVKAVAQQAKAEKLTTTPSVLQQASAKIQNAIAGNPALLSEGWSARLALLDYRSTLQEPGKENAASQNPKRSSSQIPGLPKIEGGTIVGNSQTLDGAIWKDVTFVNTRIIYNGGPMVLQNVRFENCVFDMPYTLSADRFADMVLAQTEISGSLS